MKNTEKTRGAEFYNVLALKVLERGTTTQDEFRELIKATDEELGFIYRDKYNLTVQNNFEKVFGNILEVIIEKRDDADRCRGKRLMIKVFDFKTKDRNEILEACKKYFSAIAKPKKPARTVTTLSEADKIYRDVYVGEANKIQSESPTTDRRVAVKMAKRNVRKLSKDFIKKIWKVLVAFNQSGEYQEILSSRLKEMLGHITKSEPKKWSDQLVPYGIKFHITIADYPQDNRKWVLKLNNDATELMMALANIAKKMYGMELQIPTTGSLQKSRYTRLEGTRQSMAASSEEYISPRVKYIVFAMAGIIQKQRSFVDINQICSVLRKNHYRSINVTSQEILEIVKAFPDYFERSIQRGSVGLKGHDTWSKIQKFNPKNEEWLIPWVVNSGLTLEDVQEFFPGSTQVNPDIKVGSSIYMIKADRSIGAFMKLARLQLLMRECDYPISEEGLLGRLENENKISEKLIQAVMLDRRRQSFEAETDTDQDKILYQIEENYMM
jgi:hypothetical protein